MHAFRVPCDYYVLVVECPLPGPLQKGLTCLGPSWLLVGMASEAQPSMLHIYGALEKHCGFAVLRVVGDR